MQYSLFEESLNDGREMNENAIFEYKYFELYFSNKDRDVYFVKYKTDNKLLGFVLSLTQVLFRVNKCFYVIK